MGLEPWDTASLGDFVHFRQFSLVALRNHYMIKEFLRKGEQYPGLDHLVPIDPDGHQIQDWVNSPLPVRRDYVPHEAILGKGILAEDDFYTSFIIFF